MPDIEFQITNFSDLQDAVTLKRDQIAIQNALQHLQIAAPHHIAILQTASRDEHARFLQHRLVPFPDRARHDCGESHDGAPEHFIRLTNFPKVARELPQPYTFVHANSFLAEGGKGKVQPFHLTADVFFC